jgi:hypothetical protein
LLVNGKFDVVDLGDWTLEIWNSQITRIPNRKITKPGKRPLPIKREKQKSIQ